MAVKSGGILAKMGGWLGQHFSPSQPLKRKNNLRDKFDGNFDRNFDEISYAILLAAMYAPRKNLKFLQAANYAPRKNLEKT